MKAANWSYVSITACALTALTSTFNSESTVSTNSPTPTHTSIQCTAATVTAAEEATTTITVAAKESATAADDDFGLMVANNFY